VAHAALGAPGWAAGSVRFEPVGSGAGGLTVAGKGTYRGAIEIKRAGSRSSLAVLNHLGFEEYVRGIDEVPPSWPAAALEAQAIAARTYAAHRAASTENTPWKAVGADICATPRCQVYRGLDAERKAQGHGWLPAVEATAGRVLLSGNRPILASYSATANGPVAMSQNGALAMAREGRSASEILTTFYGIRPTFAPNQLPSAIRVALSTGTSSVRIKATESFRVLDGGGAVLAAAGPGEWKVAPDGVGVRVLPPEGFSPAPGATPGSPASPDLAIEQAAAVRRPTRALTAATAAPTEAPWAVVALALVLTAGVAAITLERRRRA
jgi:hypothetical protein